MAFWDSNRNKRIQGSTANSDHDGLNSLKYTVQKLTEHRLYTLVTADVTEAMGNDKLVEKSTLANMRNPKKKHLAEQAKPN